jgi:hypothetical protein
MDPMSALQMRINRRNFFGASGLRLGGLATAILAAQGALPGKVWAGAADGRKQRPRASGSPGATALSAQG